MTFAELRAYTAEVADMGFDTTRFQVDLHGKISFPFVCLIMTLLGIPFAFSMGKKGALVGIGLSIVIAMVYWGAIGVFRSLGYVAFPGAVPGRLDPEPGLRPDRHLPSFPPPDLSTAHPAIFFFFLPFYSDPRTSAPDTRWIGIIRPAFSSRYKEKWHRGDARRKS